MTRSVQAEVGSGLLRWGGLAGLVGGALMLFVFVWVGAVVGSDPAGLDGAVIRFPGIAAARTVENSLYLAVIALWMVQVVALSRALRGPSPALASFGGALGVAGLTVLAAGALPHVVTTRLSDLYHAAGVTAEDRASIVLLWQLNQGLFDALLAVGLILLPVGIIGLGVAMLGAPAFGRGAAWVAIVLGAVALAAGAAFVIDPRSASAALGLIATIAFSIVLGWKSLRLSRAVGIGAADIVGSRAARSSLAR